MKLFLKKIFGLVSKKESASGPNSSRDFYSSVQDESESSVRAQLVHVVMRDLLRKSGIPPGWIVCQPQVLQSRSKGSGIFVRLSVKHWDDRLMQYAFAFQKALLTDIVRFEPKAGSWLHGIAWQLEVASTCPHTELPDKNFWLEAPTARRSATATATAAATATATAPSAPLTSPVISNAAQTSVPDADSDIQQDLKRLFAARDKEQEWATTNISPSAGYEGTEPAALRSQ